jgi:hypothetical protein
VRQHAPKKKGGPWGGQSSLIGPTQKIKIKIKPQIKYVVISMPPLGCLYRLQEMNLGQSLMGYKVWSYWEHVGYPLGTSLKHIQKPPPCFKKKINIPTLPQNKRKIIIGDWGVLTTN